MADNREFLVIFEWIIDQELTAQLFDNLGALVNFIFCLEGALRKLITKQLKQDSVNVGVRCPTFSLTQFVVEKLLLTWHDHSFNAPELWSFLAGDP